MVLNFGTKHFTLNKNFGLNTEFLKTHLFPQHLYFNNCYITLVIK